MSDHGNAVLGASEGATADIAWAVIYVMCWILMAAPFVLWYAGVRTPRAERRAARERPADAPALEADESEVSVEQMTA